MLTTVNQSNTIIGTRSGNSARPAQPLSGEAAMPKSKVNAIPPCVKNLIGRVFGRLTVLGFSRIKRRHAFWHCGCECGKTVYVRTCHLLDSSTRSCGCKNRENRYKHGHTIDENPSPEYACWVGMKKRCSNKNRSDYKYYGARGITVCKRWRDSFAAFLDDMGRKPSPKHSIDRINCNGNYSKRNCRWATASEQRRNRRK